MASDSSLLAWRMHHEQRAGGLQFMGHRELEPQLSPTQHIEPVEQMYTLEDMPQVSACGRVSSVPGPSQIGCPGMRLGAGEGMSQALNTVGDWIGRLESPSAGLRDCKSKARRQEEDWCGEEEARVRRREVPSREPRGQMKHWDSWGPLGMQAQDAHPWGSPKASLPRLQPFLLCPTEGSGPGGAVPCTGFCQVRRVPAWAVRAGCSGTVEVQGPLLAEVSSARREGVYSLEGLI